MTVLRLHPCARASSSCGKWGPLLIAVRGPLTIAASLVAEHRLQTRRLSNCGSRAQLLRGTWDPPRPGLEPVSPALAGRPSTTAPPGKPGAYFLVTKILGSFFFHLVWLIAIKIVTNVNTVLISFCSILKCRYATLRIREIRKNLYISFFVNI